MSGTVGEISDRLLLSRADGQSGAINHDVDSPCTMHVYVAIPDKCIVTSCAPRYYTASGFIFSMRDQLKYAPAFALPARARFKPLYMHTVIEANPESADFHRPGASLCGVRVCFLTFGVRILVPIHFWRAGLALY